jgi:putative tryptophan/tyrosine transport system substrate-binding protein
MRLSQLLYVSGPALFVGGDPFFTSRRVQLANLGARHVLPMTSAVREIAEVGGLMSYGSNIADAWRQVGIYAGRILKGAKPADLPVMQSSKLELVVNHQTPERSASPCPRHCSLAPTR